MRGVYFNTTNNTYFYNETNGEINFIPSISRQDDEFVYDKESTEKYNNSNDGVSKDYIRELINTVGFNQLTLVLTENCNIRCKYCVYSGVYDNSRGHEKDNYMTYEVAKKSCDIYMDSFLNKGSFMPLKTPTIGFYGGEPLLNFEVLKKTVEYVNKKYGKVQYTVSTNGVLLTDEVVDFLVENDFLIAISINGDKKENDRLRVDINGKGTYDNVVCSINKVIEKQKEIQSKIPILLLATIDVGTDLIRLKEFFDGNEFKNSNVMLSRISAVFDDFTDWYSRYDENTKNKYIMQLKELREKYYDDIKDNIKPSNFDKLVFGLEHKKIINRFHLVHSNDAKPKCLRKSGACIPLTKVSVDYKGDFYVCEKMNSSRNLGNCNDGFNYDNIENLILDFNESTKNCQKCPVERLCDHCYATSLDLNGEFKIPSSKKCDKNRANILRSLKDVYELYESGVDLNTFYLRGEE